MKRILFITAAILVSVFAKAQQDIMVSQYMFNGLLLNPAYAGSHKYFSSSLLHRSQWVGFDGAPQSSVFAVDGPLKNEEMGVGLIISNDHIGVTDQTDIFGNYSYQLPLGKGKLAFGIKAGASRYSYQYDKLTYWDETDMVFTGSKNSAWLPKFGCGTYYYSERWYAGLSVPTLLAYDPDHNFSIDVNESTFIRRHYFLTSGYVVDLNSQFKLKPSFLLKYVPNAPLEADINLNLLYKDQFWFGVSGRSGDAITVMIEYQTNCRLRAGYAYDFTTSKLKNYSAGTHEIMIGYDFGKDIVKVKTPRFF
jgi:type IX secretion system PorP/SprF family membrane protein